MSIPTASDAVEHYQSQVPLLRSDFQNHLRAIRLDHQKHDRLFTNEYVEAISRAAEEEVRKRTRLATQSLLDAMDAGWRPDENELPSLFGACFSPSHYERDSFTDIRDSLNEITSKLGRPPDHERETLFNRAIGRTQVAASEKSMAELKMRLRKLQQSTATDPIGSGSRESAGVSGQILKSADSVFVDAESFGVDEIQVKLLEYLEAHGESEPSFGSIAHDIALDYEVLRDEIWLLNARGLIRVKSLPGIPEREGRILLLDAGRAVVAKNRKALRSDDARTQKTLEIAKRLIEGYLVRDSRELSEEVRRVQTDCAGQGIFQSSAMVQLVEEVLIKAVQQRGDRVISLLNRAILDSHVKPSSQQTRDILNSISTTLFEDADLLLKESINATGITAPSIRERSEALKRIENEVLGRVQDELDLISLARADDSTKRRENMTADNEQSDLVFITHGRDGSARDAVRTYIYEIGLKPIVLEDQANAGMTIIEKYEKHSRVGYGIAILSPDDVGCLKPEAPDGLKPRARQNVVFELGYMFASINRHRVAVLVTDPTIEKPTNIEGIVWIHLDTNGGWKHRLRKELIEAGLELKG